MSLIRLLIIFFIGYFVLKLVKRLLMPSRSNRHVHDQSKKSNIPRKSNDIQDIEYEEID
jgi:hypothetical protein